MSATDSQEMALILLKHKHGPLRYVNRFKPEVAIWADFDDLCFRITPDGCVQDVTEALLDGWS